MTLTLHSAVSALRRILRGLVRDIVVGDVSILEIASLTPAPGDGLIGYGVIVGFGVLENDVPGVNQTGKEAQRTQREVDDRVCSAESHFDPD